MISEITIDDKNRFDEIGLLVNSNFKKLYQIEELINSTYDKVYGYYINELLVGFIHINILYETMDIVNVVVDEKYRNKGIATSLIKHIMNTHTEVEKIMLEVNEHNEKAINLYTKNGFREISRREKYYGKDTAIIMERDV